MATDPPTGFGAGLERSQAAIDAGGLPLFSDPAMLDTRAPHAVGGVGSAETYGLAGVGEASFVKQPHTDTHKARLGAHARPIGGGHSGQQGEGHEAHTAGAASFEGQKQCQCVQDGKCTCKGTCSCTNCAGTHTEEQLRGKSSQNTHAPQSPASERTVG